MSVLGPRRTPAGKLRSLPQRPLPQQLITSFQSDLELALQARDRLNYPLRTVPGLAWLAVKLAQSAIADADRAVAVAQARLEAAERMHEACCWQRAISAR